MGDIVDTSRQDLYQVVAKHGGNRVADAGCKENFTLLAPLCCGGEGAIAPANLKYSLSSRLLYRVGVTVHTNWPVNTSQIQIMLMGGLG